MPARDSENNQWTDPKDYGLPFVEVTPLGAKSSPFKKNIVSTSPAPVVQQVQDALIPSISELETEPVSVENVVEMNSNEVEKPVEVDLEEVEEPVRFHSNREAETEVSETKPEIPRPATPIATEKKKTASWVWAVFILGFGIVSFIVWQLQSRDSSPTNVSKAEVADNVTIVESETKQEIDPESTRTDQNQTTVNQDSITIINNSNPNISNPAQTGTTIANVASGNLIRIESKTERPQYFIIVGSLPNEKLAIEVASKYFEKTPEMYLVSPEEGSRNYRIGLSKFGSFNLAAEELTRIKSQYTEELWILKY
ncbi:hypothetical protein [Algoriphagus sp.]|uniref:hypothetical protein n=1 Tax=Algoriphagus sp. TaxID=1872435 RepID=UPI00391CDF3B